MDRLDSGRVEFWDGGLTIDPRIIDMLNGDVHG